MEAAVLPEASSIETGVSGAGLSIDAPASNVPPTSPPKDPAKISATGEREPRRFLQFFWLFIITLFGGALRFLWLDRPPIWGDEALTYGRVCGTFAELMQRLQTAGFAPVHYELYWWIGQHAQLTPFMMRLVPAIAGTLMIPAMYWLAAQLIGSRAALLTALLTATSAYLLNYSRDAKMYSPFWLFAAINVAALLWWLRVRTPLSWCVWLASGTAMVGFDALGWITIAIELLMILSGPRGNWNSLPRLMLLLLSVSIVWIMTIGLIVLAMSLADHAYGVVERWVAICIIVIALLRIVLRSIGSWRATRGKSSLLDRLFKLPSERDAVRPWIARRIERFSWPPVALFLVGVGIMFAGPFGYYYDFNRFLARMDEAGWNGTGIQWVERYNADRTGPSLVGYTASAFLTSWEWPRTEDEPDITPRTLRLLKGAVIGIAGVLALGLLPLPWSRTLRPHPMLHGWRSALWLTLWLALPPYAFYCVSISARAGPHDWAMATMQTLRRPGWITLVVALEIGWLWISGPNWRTRALRTFQCITMMIVTLVALSAIYEIYPKIDAAMSLRSEGWREHGSVWMPRYLAVVLPAFLIVVSAILWRLPTRPLKWGAIALLVIVNLSVHGARVFAGTEQPSPLIARDVIDSQNADKTDGSFRAYFQQSLGASGAEPGSTSFHSTAMRYYLAILSDRSTHPNEVMDDSLHTRLRPGRTFLLTFSGAVINDIRRSPNVRHFVTWERLAPDELDLTDKPLDVLAPGWRMVKEQSFAVRDHWRWMNTAVLRRREYQRTASTMP